MAEWDDDDDELSDDDDGQDDDGEWSLTEPEDADAEPFDFPSWEEWFDFDWESYDGEYEEFAVSADYEG